MNIQTVSRIRLKFDRLESAKRYSHLMQIKEFRSRIINSGLPYQGVSGNNLKMSFGPALPEGYLSNCEYADVYLYNFVLPDTAYEKIKAFDDNCFKLISAARIPVFFPPSETTVNAVKYTLVCDTPAFEQSALDKFLSLDTLEYIKVKTSGKIQKFDIRKTYAYSKIEKQGMQLQIVLNYGTGANLKPDMAANLIFGINREYKEIIRNELLWKNSKGELEVL